MQEETRTANGDLTFPHSDDKIVQARNNLRYWVDRNRFGQVQSQVQSEIMEAARHMIDVIDEHYEDALGDAWQRGINQAAESGWW